MSAGDQSRRHLKLVSLSQQLEQVDAHPQHAELIDEIDGLIQEAAGAPQVCSHAEAAASLDIALYSLGAEAAPIRPEEKLIQLALGFLRNARQS
jgi:hypothetical protein